MSPSMTSMTDADIAAGPATAGATAGIAPGDAAPDDAGSVEELATVPAGGTDEPARSVTATRPNTPAAIPDQTLWAVRTSSSPQPV